jgi:uncharacterized pyridoxamine 5'-phosphate oxidase family protein
MKPILDFLAEAKTFYFATVDGDLPRVRPFGFFMEYGGRLYFGMGKHKESYSQLHKNPNVEVSATNAAERWIRIRGIAEFDDDPQALRAAFEKVPFLKTIYNDETGFQMGLVYLMGGVAEITGMDGYHERFSF